MKKFFAVTLALTIFSTNTVFADEITNMMIDLGYENIYLLGHSQGGILAPRIYENNDGVYDGLIILGGTPRTLSDVAIDQITNSYEVIGMDEDSEAYINGEIEKINSLDTMTDDELKQTYIAGMPAYYLKEMNSYNTSEIAKRIDKPFLILQGSEDFQVFEAPDYELWKEVLKDNEEAEFVLYEDLGHFFTKAPEYPAYATVDYIPAQKMDSRVIEDIWNFIESNN